ncbi:hypothetical protein B0O80DRAFT_431311 [Mortierella sp. GBAus27b]|nr:hypothetical protein B0O80DRAFT_431311 [Mortierella sp. GBAus27b]
MTDNPLTLFCVVDGEATSNTFSVKIPASDTIYDLKKLIKAKKPHDLRVVDANKLTLWHVETPATPARQITLSLPNEESILSRLNLNEDQQAVITRCQLNDEDVVMSVLFTLTPSSCQ